MHLNYHYSVVHIRNLYIALGNSVGMEDLIRHDHNVLFVTLDSCRMDTYMLAKTPVMDAIGGVRQAQTVANFTLPAHTSFFAGHLPVVRDASAEDFFTKEGAPLWKLGVARHNGGRAGVHLEGYSIQEGYRNKGFTLRGFGGSTFFAHPGKQLCREYAADEFFYCGQSTAEAPRPVTNLPLSNIDTIVASLDGAENWFLFINETATHVPYHIGDVDDEMTELINYASRQRAGRRDPDHRYNQEDGKRLFDLQIRALEYVDAQLGSLLDALPWEKPAIVAICGDHGESFGEFGRWGHLHNAPEVLAVPLLINTAYHHTLL
jgi:hypothetical protein